MTLLAFRTSEEQRRNAPRVAAHLRASAIIAYPTETVYGLGCALRDDALTILARLKGRAPGKPFLLLVPDAGHAAGVRWNSAARSLASSFWPGPLTLVLPAEPGAFPPAVTQEGAVAIRASPHAGVRAILSELGEPLTSTSANRPGEEPALDARGARAVLDTAGEVAALILDGGRLEPSPPSTIVDCTTERPRLVRHGAVSLEQLRAVVKEIDV